MENLWDRMPYIVFLDKKREVLKNSMHGERFYFINSVELNLVWFNIHFFFFFGFDFKRSFVVRSESSLFTFDPTVNFFKEFEQRLKC